MTRSIEELTRIQHLWADAGNPDAGVLADALAHVKLSREITPEELEDAARALFEEQERMLPEGVTWEDQCKSQANKSYWTNSALRTIGAFLEHRAKKGQGDDRG